VYASAVTISVVIITLNEEENLGRTLKSVTPLVRDGRGEIIVVDSGSTDRTLEIARMHGAKIFSEPWKGFAGQKNSAMDKATGDWILQLDADESLEADLQEHLAKTLDSLDRFVKLLRQQSVHHFMLEDAREELEKLIATNYSDDFAGLWIPRKNFFLNRWIRHGGYYPDYKLRFVRRGSGNFEEYGAHPTIKVKGSTGRIHPALMHNAYPTLSGYIQHMNSYSSMGAKLLVQRGKGRFAIANILFRPAAQFIYNYFFRLGFLDGREGLLLHLYHAAYVSWKYAKVWEFARAAKLPSAD
jgi:glycosyltransferase involved in cell wall biosynthesis